MDDAHELFNIEFKDASHLVGRKIIAIRPMSTAELEVEGWYPNVLIPAIVLDDGTILYPSGDEEGNSGGDLFGINPDKSPFAISFQESSR